MLSIMISIVLSIFLLFSGIALMFMIGLGGSGNPKFAEIIGNFAIILIFSPILIFIINAIIYFRKTKNLVKSVLLIFLVFLPYAAWYGNTLAEQYAVKLIYSHRDGWERKYYPNGTLQSETYWKNNKAEGRAVTYFENGKIAEEYYLQDSMSQGVYKKYFENGQIEVEENYLNGKQDGKRTEYNIDGTIKDVSMFSNGIRVNQ